MRRGVKGMKKKTASEIRNGIYLALKNAKENQLTYKELLEILDVPNTNFAGAIQYISKYYPEVVKVKRGTYKLMDNISGSTFKFNLRNDLERIISQVQFNNFDEADYELFKKLVDLKKEVEDIMNVHQ